MRHSRHRPVQPKPPPDGISPSKEAQLVLAHLLRVAGSHDHSNPQQQDDGDGPLFAHRLLHILRTKRSWNLPLPEDPEAYHLVVLYWAALDVKQLRSSDTPINPDNSTPQECRIIAGLEKLSFDWKRLRVDETLRNPYENLRGFAEVATLRAMPWDPSWNEGTERLSNSTSETKGMFDNSKASAHSPEPVPARSCSSTVRTSGDERMLPDIYRISKADLRRRVKSCMLSPFLPIMNIYKLRPFHLTFTVSTDHLPNKFCYDLQGNLITLARRNEPEFIAIYHPLYNIPAQHPSGCVGSEEAVRLWVRRLVVQTAQKMLHISDPSTSAWSFDDIIGQEEQDLRSSYSWHLGMWSEVDVVHRLIVQVKAPCKLCALRNISALI